MARVLVVDDEPSLRFGLRRALEQRGHDVREAGNGALALEKVRLYAPEVVITDVVMPVMSGAKLAQCLRADTTTAGIPIIMLGANIPLGAPADATFGKPSRAQEIVEAVDALLGERSRVSR